MKELILKRKNENATFLEIGNKNRHQIRSRNMVSNAKFKIPSEKSYFKLLATNPHNSTRVNVLNSVKISIGISIENIQIKKGVIENSLAIMQEKQNGIEDIICIIEIRSSRAPRASRLTVNPKNTKNALKDLYLAESLEIDEFSKAIAQLRKSNKSSIRKKL